MISSEPFHPKYRLVQQQLLNDIKEGRFRDHACLPSEIVLATHYQVSRSTLRQALQSLRSDGWLRTRQGSRSFVCKRPQPVLRRLVWLGIGNPMDMNPVLAATYTAFVQLAEEHHVHVGYWMLDNPNQENWFIRTVRNIDGVLLAAVGREPLSDALNSKLQAISNCVTLVERSDLNVGAIVRSDDYAAGELAGEALLRHGYRKILILAVSPGLNINPFYLRVEGCVNRLLTSGLPEVRLQILASDRDADFADPRPLLEQAGISRNAWDAVFCITDHYALCCLEALRKMGLRVPDDLGLISVDNIDAGIQSDPPLTSVAHDSSGMVAAAFEILSGRRQPGTVSLTPILHERSSLRQQT